MIRTSDPIVVVGAGPAGAVSALLLARAGARVVIVERKPFPRAKPCGDCLSAGLEPVLARLGVLDAVVAAAPAHLRGWRLFDRDGADARLPFADGNGGPRALALRRGVFDAVLLDAALAAGVELRQDRIVDLARNAEGAPVLALASGARLPASFVVGADGLRSVVARRIGAIRRTPRLRKVSFTAHVSGVRDLEPWGELHLGAHGCAGLAPIADGDTGERTPCNLTLVLDLARAAAPRPRPSPAELLPMLRAFPRLAPRVQDVRFHAHGGDAELLASGPFDWPTRNVCAPGVALVGDAAGYFDPFTGQGIFHAVADAMLLADAVAHNDAGPETVLADFARRRRTRVAETRLLQRLIEHVVARPALARTAIRALARSPQLAQAIVAATGDLTRARSLLSPRLLSTLLRPQPSQEVSP